MIWKLVKHYQKVVIKNGIGHDTKNGSIQSEKLETKNCSIKDNSDIVYVIIILSIKW
jgi:hypothetical protein